MDAGVVRVGFEFIFLGRLGSVEGGPGLAVSGNVLAGVLAVSLAILGRFVEMVV